MGFSLDFVHCAVLDKIWSFLISKHLICHCIFAKNLKKSVVIYYSLHWMCFVVSCNRVRNYVQFGTRWPAGFGTKSFFLHCKFLDFSIGFSRKFGSMFGFWKKISLISSILSCQKSRKSTLQCRKWYIVPSI